MNSKIMTCLYRIPACVGLALGYRWSYLEMMLPTNVSWEPSESMLKQEEAFPHLYTLSSETVFLRSAVLSGIAALRTESLVLQMNAISINEAGPLNNSPSLIVDQRVCNEFMSIYSAGNEQFFFCLVFHIVKQQSQEVWK